MGIYKDLGIRSEDGANVKMEERCVSVYMCAQDRENIMYLMYVGTYLRYMHAGEIVPVQVGCACCPFSLQLERAGKIIYVLVLPIAALAARGTNRSGSGGYHTHAFAVL